MRIFSFLCKTCLIAITSISLIAHADIKNPRAVVEDSANGITNELSLIPVEKRTEAKIRELVTTWLIPIIDEERVAMGILSKHWRAASAEQREAFIRLYREQQINTYGGAFKSFNGEKFTFSNAQFNDKGDRAIVKATVIEPSGQTVPVDFRLYQRTPNSPWLVYDATVAGLGMVKTYRDQLNERLQNISMDELLKELAEQTKN